MKIADLDYYSTFGNTFLHKLPANIKLSVFAAILITVLSFKNICIYSFIYIFLLFILVISGIPRKKAFAASLYPLIFTVIFLLSYENLTVIPAIMLILRVLCISTSLILIIFTTPYIKIFSALSKFLPDIVLNILFNAYRALFIITNILDNLLTAIKLRGNLSILKPIHLLENIGNLLGFFVIKSIETSEKMYEGIKLRGYTDKYFFIKD